MSFARLCVRGPSDRRTESTLVSLRLLVLLLLTLSLSLVLLLLLLIVIVLVEPRHLRASTAAR